MYMHMYVYMCGPRDVALPMHITHSSDSSGSEAAELVVVLVLIHSPLHRFPLFNKLGDTYMYCV